MFLFLFFLILLLDTVLNGIDEGGGGAVLKVRDSANRIFALKKFKIDTKDESSIQVDKEKILNEVAIGRNPNLNSKYLMRYLDYFEVESGCYVVMEFCEAGDLDSKINKLKKENVLLNDEV
jgi:serine/threonine protein kinase